MSELYIETQIDVLRHGECEGGHIFRGSTDVALLEKGFENMQQSCNCMATDWDIIVTSPLKRCQYFALHLAKKNRALLEQDERLREMSFGDWEGQEIDVVWRQHEAQMCAWRNDPFVFTPPGAEPLAEVFARVEAFQSDLLDLHKGKNILLITHGGVTRVLLAIALGLPVSCVNRFYVPYANISRYKVFHQPEKDMINLIGHNLAHTVSP